MSVGRRGYPKEWRAKAAELRQQGVSRANIARQLGVSFSTVARWFREEGLVLPPGASRDELRRLSNRRTIDERWRLQQEEQDRHRDAVGELTDRELFLVGVALYWAEGEKSKPWRRLHRLRMVNSDETVIRVFLAWLALLGVEPDRVAFRLHIHETADVEAAERYWRTVVGSGARFNRTSLKTHRPRTNRRNIADGYNGCLVVDVARSAPLYRRMAGAWDGIAAAVASTEDPERSPVV